LTRVTLFWGEKGLLGLESRGHSGFAPKGEDIVCAAVSALVQALLVGLRDVARVEDAVCEIENGTKTENETEDSASLIRVRWKEDRAAGLDLLTRTVALSLKEIASGYSDYVSVSEVYVS
jgi:uncharacterized protein YsxB (DUF464 family)